MVKRSILRLLLGGALIVVIGCGRPHGPATGSGRGGGDLTSLSGSIAIDGSSTVYPVTEAVVEEFQSATGGRVRPTVGIKGTGGGFKRFTRGEIDVAGASRPILAEEMEAARAGGVKYIELPVCFDALTVVVHPSNDWVDHLTVEELKKMWEPEAEGRITRWNQIRPDWPDEEIALFGPGADSGTFDYFTEAVCGKAKSSRGDFTASEDDNVLVQGVAGNKYALGYFGYAYYPSNQDKLKAVAIDWEKDEEGPVMPSADTVLKGTYNPLSRPLFIYVSAKSAERPEVEKFVDFYLENVPQLASEVKYVPLPAETYTAAKERFQKRQTGTAFGGVPEVGLPVEEILKREPKE